MDLDGQFELNHFFHMIENVISVVRLKTLLMDFTEQENPEVQFHHHIPMSAKNAL